MQVCHSIGDAKTKWCPFARVPDGNNTHSGLTATNRHAGEKKRKDGKVSRLRSSAMCIASECMQWQWVTRQGMGLHETRRVDTDKGFCGLAGKP